MILVPSTAFGQQLRYGAKPTGETLWVTLYDPGTLGSQSAGAQWCADAFRDLSQQARDDACYVRQITAPHK